MKLRMLVVCITLFLVLAIVNAQTKSDSKQKSTDTKQSSCCMKDAKAAKDGKECTMKDAKTDKECTDAEKAKCDQMKGTKASMKKAGSKMDCCKEMDCCKDKGSKAENTKKPKETGSTTDVKGTK